eukprot:TRINITY_DN9443_c0_g1_i1.p2 TRINITY_DN9443_c0_g1~~TRINITY_DN9443_c0_g1_i1.p2  ORF type:complete len:66 (+),score=6.02 TRINITY_DN9443_c0_g1_i1:129-326(+)
MQIVEMCLHLASRFEVNDPQLISPAVRLLIRLQQYLLAACTTRKKSNERFRELRKVFRCILSVGV